MILLSKPTLDGTTAEQLEALALRLAEAIDGCYDERNMPALARQYRETVKALAEIRGTDDEEDGTVDAIIAGATPSRPRRAD